MNRVRNSAALFGLLGIGLAHGASDVIYDEKADAHRQVAAAINEASRSGKNIALIFGANW